MNAPLKNAFVTAAYTVPFVARTQNDMKAQESTMSAVVDLFYNIGASRGKDITPMFERAFQEDVDLAIRVAQWARDVRGGAGERQLFRDILRHLEMHHSSVLLSTNLLNNVSVIGRWDDLLVFNHDAAVKSKVFGIIRDALKAGDGLCAKWMPRKGIIAVELRKFLDLSPKAYRKLLVGLTKVVETALCNKNYDDINYSHVPSLAMSRYMKAFSKNDKDRFVAYREALKTKTAGVKINAGAVYPYDIIKSMRYGGDREVNNAQWDALPNYMSDSNVLPMVDVSGSMSCLAGGNDTISCLDVAISLGLYCADKNRGEYKDMFLTFSKKPQLEILVGTLSEKIAQLEKADWEMNTNLHAAFELVLKVAVEGRVPQTDMPSIILVLSDMQFDCCTKYDDSAIEMMRRKYAEAGYDMPTIVFWNLNASYKNSPVSFNEKGVCLVSGFSPAIMKAILGSNMDEMSPKAMVCNAVCIERYDYFPGGLHVERSKL